jgi:hypothetical protein
MISGEIYHFIIGMSNDMKFDIDIEGGHIDIESF